jgi:hypothetical protein
MADQMVNEHSRPLCSAPRLLSFLTAILTGMRLGELLAMKGAIWTGIRVNIL